MAFQATMGDPGRAAMAITVRKLASVVCVGHCEDSPFLFLTRANGSIVQG
jgi:hypothetical protein